LAFEQIGVRVDHQQQRIVRLVASPRTESLSVMDQLARLRVLPGFDERAPDDRRAQYVEVCPARLRCRVKATLREMRCKSRITAQLGEHAPPLVVEHYLGRALLAQRRTEFVEQRRRLGFRAAMQVEKHPNDVIEK